MTWEQFASVLGAFTAVWIGALAIITGLINKRIDDARVTTSARIDDLDKRIDHLREEMLREFGIVRTELRELRAILERRTPA